MHVIEHVAFLGYGITRHYVVDGKNGHTCADSEADGCDHQSTQNRVLADTDHRKAKIVKKHCDSPCGGLRNRAKRRARNYRHFHRNRFSDMTVVKMDVALGMTREHRIMGDHDNRRTFAVNIVEEIHDTLSGL